MDFGRRLEDLRIKRGLTKKQLAIKASLSTVQLHRYMENQALPNIQTLTRLADALDIDEWYFFEMSSSKIEKRIDSLLKNYKHRLDDGSKLVFLRFLDNLMSTSEVNRVQRVKEAS